MDELIYDINSQDIVDGVKLRAAEDSSGNVTLEMIETSRTTYMPEIDLNYDSNTKTVEIVSIYASQYLERKMSIDAFIAWAKAGIELAERIKDDNPD